MDDTIEIRADEALERTRLEPYLRERLPQTSGEFSIRQFDGGMANLTYALRFGDTEYVLRRPPYGPLPRGGHDMQREYRVLSRLFHAFPLAPRAYVLCTDHDIVGADFVVMERRVGTVIRRSLPESIAGDPDACRRLGENFIDTLAALHRVDYAATGLGELGKPEGYLARQLGGWIARWVAAETPDRLDARDLVERLQERLPNSGPPAIVHNDFKLDNAIVDSADPTRFVAILDWDMCTIGDPLADLGNVLALWTEADDPLPGNLSAMPSAAPGFAKRAELTARYAAKTGRDCSRAAWYEAFSAFRYAVIAQQIYARFVRGQTSDPRFENFAPYVRIQVERARALADRGI